MLTTLKTRCPHCQASLKVKESQLGKRAGCPACKQTFVIDSVEVPTGSPTLQIPLHATETVENAAADTGELEPGEAIAPSPEAAALGCLGRFQLKELLGQGTFGRVYKAYDPQLDRFVALKVPTFGPEDTRKIQRFIAEAKAAARLRHPNIVPTYESGQIGGQYYIAAQYIAGQTLSRRIKDKLPAFRQAADWVRQLADALAYAHGEGIVHRDIKPENVMLDEKGVPHIMDFGLAKRLNEDSAMTTDGSLLGTPAYMSPEQARGRVSEVGPASDQYSLGAVLYELITGQRPFDGSPHAVIAQVISTEPPAPRTLRPNVPRDIEAICQKAMSKEVSHRYASAAELAADLTRWLAGDATLARPIRWRERLARWSRREPRLAALSLASACLLLLGTFLAVAWAVTAQRNEQRLSALLADLQTQTDRANAAADRATEAERLAEQKAADAIAERDRADRAAEEATANLRLANENKAELEKALGIADSAKLAELRASETAKKSVEEQRKSDYRATLAEARHLLNEQRHTDALQVLDGCAADLRDASWTALHEEATRQNFRSYEVGILGRVYFAPNEDTIVLDGDDTLQLKKISNGEQVYKLGSRPRLPHLTFFVSPTGSSIDLVQLYENHVFSLNSRTLRTATVQIPGAADASGFKPSKSKTPPKRFTLSPDIVPYDIGYGRPPPTTAGAMNGAVLACSLLDKSAWREWQIGIDGRMNKLLNGRGDEYRTFEPKPVAVDLYGAVSIFSDSRNCWLEYRVVGRDNSKNNAEQNYGTAAQNSLDNVHNVPKSSNDDHSRWAMLTGTRTTPVSDACIGGGSVALVYPDEVEVWTVQSWKEGGHYSSITETAHWGVSKNSVSLVAVSADGNLVATYSRDKTISVHIAKTGSLIRKFSDQQDVRNLEFDRALEVQKDSPALVSTPNRTRLAWISDKGLCIWTYQPQVSTAADSPSPARSAAPAPVLDRDVRTTAESSSPVRSTAPASVLRNVKTSPAVLNTLDKNGDGKLSWEEFRNGTTGGQTRKADEFVSRDRDGDRFLSRDELGQD